MKGGHYLEALLLAHSVHIYIVVHGLLLPHLLLPNGAELDFCDFVVARHGGGLFRNDRRRGVGCGKKGRSHKDRSSGRRMQKRQALPRCDGVYAPPWRAMQTDGDCHATPCNSCDPPTPARPSAESWSLGRMGRVVRTSSGSLVMLDLFAWRRGLVF